MHSTEVTVVLPILIQHEWQRIMTRCCIDTMYATTRVPFKLIIVETGAFRNWQADKYISLKDRTCYAHDFNVGLKEVNTKFVVHMGNDVMTRPGWLEGMFELFTVHPDQCGFASPAFNEHFPVMEQRLNNYLGFYPHCMMFRRDYGLLDEVAFPSVFSDTDLVARIFVERGLVPLINPRVRVADMINQTFSGGLETKEQADKKFETAREEFRRRYGHIKTSWMRGLCGYDS